jgi:hypothetical protein
MRDPSTPLRAGITRIPCAFTAPHGDDPERYVLWVSSPSGHFMLLAGSWGYIETARLFAVRCGYKMIATDIGLAIVEQQMDERATRPVRVVH